MSYIYIYIYIYIYKICPNWYPKYKINKIQLKGSFISYDLQFKFFNFHFRNLSLWAFYNPFGLQIGSPTKPGKSRERKNRFIYIYCRYYCCVHLPFICQSFLTWSFAFILISVTNRTRAIRGWKSRSMWCLGQCKTTNLSKIKIL